MASGGSICNVTVIFDICWCLLHTRGIFGSTLRWFAGNVARPRSSAKWLLSCLLLYSKPTRSAALCVAVIELQSIDCKDCESGFVYFMYYSTVTSVTRNWKLDTEFSSDVALEPVLRELSCTNSSSVTTMQVKLDMNDANVSSWHFQRVAQKIFQMCCNFTTFFICVHSICWGLNRVNNLCN